MMNFVSCSKLKLQPAIFLTIVFVTVASACSNNQSEHVETVKAKPFSDTLQAQAISLKSDSLLYHPFRIRNVGDKYLILNYRKENDFFYVYTLPAIQLLYTWGRQGRGPDEFIQPPDYLNQKGSTLIIHDPIMRELRSYRVSDSTFLNLNHQALSYKKQRSPLNDIQRINDSLYFATYGTLSDTAEHEYVALRPDQKKALFKFGEYPETELTRWERFSEFSKSNTAKPDGSKFITFYLNYNKYKVFDSKGNLLKEVQIEDSFIPKSNNATYRTVFYASDQYIYSAEIYDAADSLKEEGAPFQPSLEVWDWTGKPVYRAKFDRLIKQFTISEKHQKLYGVSLENRNVVFEYDLPDALGLD